MADVLELRNDFPVRERTASPLRPTPLGASAFRALGLCWEVFTTYCTRLKLSLSSFGSLDSGTGFVRHLFKIKMLVTTYLR